MGNFSLGEAVLGTGIDLAGLNQGLAKAEGGARDAVGKIGGFFSNALSSALGFIGANVLSAAGGAIVDFAKDSFTGALEAQQGLDAMDAALKRVQESSAAQAAEFAKASQTMVTGTVASQSQLDKWGTDLAKAQARLTDMQTRLADKTPTETQKLQLQELQSTVATLTDNIQRGSQVVTGNLADSLGMVAPAATITREELLKLADEYKNLARGSDDAVIAAETVLLRFNKIGAETFPRVLESSLDLATVLKTEPAKAAEILGKTLQDLSTDGAGSLGRLKAAGLQLTDATEKQILKMVESGNVADAQNLLLDELAKTTGGAAAQAAETLSGRWAIFKEAIADAGEGVMLTLMPALTGLATDVLPRLMPVIEAVATNATAFITETLLPAFQQAVVWVQTNWPAIQTTLLQVWGQIEPVLAWFGNIVSGTILPALMTAVNWVVANWPAVQATIAAVWAAIQPVLQALVDIWNTNVLPAFQAVVSWVQANWPLIQTTIAGVMTFVAGLVQQVLAGLQAWWAEHGASVMTIVTTLYTTVQSLVQTGLAFIQSVIAAVLPAIQAFWATWGGDITAVVSGLFAVVGDLFDAFALAFSGDWRGFGEQLREAWDKIWEGIKEIVNRAVEWFTSQDWGKIGQSIIEGIGKGITAATGFIVDAAKQAAQAALDALKGLLHIDSPSKVTADLVGLPAGQGIAVGLLDSLPDIRAAARAAAGALMDNSRSTVQNFQLSVNSQQSLGAVTQDFALMQALATV